MYGSTHQTSIFPTPKMTKHVIPRVSLGRKLNVRRARGTHFWSHSGADTPTLTLTLTIVCSQSAIKGANCVVCKLFHCEYRASEGANHQNMSLQCIVFSGLTCSQHAIKLILVSDEVDLRVDSNDSSPMCISCKTKKLFKLLLGSSQHEQSIAILNQTITYFMNQNLWQHQMTMITTTLLFQDSEYMYIH